MHRKAAAANVIGNPETRRKRQILGSISFRSNPVSPNMHCQKCES